METTSSSERGTRSEGKSLPMVLRAFLAKSVNSADRPRRDIHGVLSPCFHNELIWLVVKELQVVQSSQFAADGKLNTDPLW